jgi:3-oxoacyl-[acyl-carrier protein] reductase
MYNPFDFSGKHVLVTGGTRGIGLGISLAFQNQGAQVTALCRNKLNAELDLTQKNIDVVEVDCSCERQVQEFFQWTKAQNIRFDHLINNVGVAKTQLVCFTDVELIDSLMKTNVASAFHMTKLITANQPETLDSIVNIGSVSEYLIKKGNAAYAMSKSALSELSRHAAMEYAERGIRVNVLVPGLTETEIIRDQSYATMRQEFVEASLLGRLATVEEIAQAAMFLCSSAASYMTGASLLVSGGQVLYG